MTTTYTLKDSSSKDTTWRFSFKEAAITSIFTLFFIGCFYLFNYQNYLVVPDRSQLSWASKLLSMLDSIMILVVITLFLSKVIKVSTWVFCINIMRGYLIAALVIHLLYPSTSHNIFIDFLHHTIVFSITLYINKYPKYIAIGFISEATLIPMYCTWYLLKWGLGNSLACKLLALLTLVLYLVCRVFVFTYLLWVMWRNYREKSKETTLLEAISVFPIVILNYYWFGLLLQKAYAQLC